MPELFKTRKGQAPVRLASTSGHVVIVGSDWQEVLDPMIPDALRSGLLSKELYEAAMAEVKANLPPPAPEAPPAPPAPEAPEAPEAPPAAPPAPAPNPDPAQHLERTKVVLTAVKAVLDLKATGESVTPGGKALVSVLNGVPKVDAVSELAGVKVTAAEIEEALR